MGNTDNMEFDSVCEKVRFAVSVGDELTEEMNEHLEKCEECRTFLGQSEIMQKTLGTMNVPTFMKDGKTVADSVMEEIRRQEFFTKGRPVKTSSKPFKHMGLVAACILIAVMVFPLVKTGLLSSKNSDAVEYDNGEIKFYSLESPTSGASESESVILGKTTAALNVTEADQEENVADMVVADNIEIEAPRTYSMNMSLAPAPVYDAYGNEVEPHSSVEDDSEYSSYYGFDYNSVELVDYSSQVFESAEEAAVYGALVYCDGRAEVIEDTLAITYTDDGEAYAVFEISGNEKITVYLKQLDAVWYVEDVCDGDITE